MLVSLNWLKEFVDIDRSAEEVANLLTMGGIEVDSVTRVGTGLDNVYTAKIEEITPHHASDKLNLARVSIGDRELTVVCGAPNIRVGQIVPYAAPGTKLPAGEAIEAKEVKGVFSAGMLCSEKELDLGDDASGVLVLEPDAKVGLPLTKALPGIEDFILEISITPNRGDCLSVMGIAREVAALTAKPWRTPETVFEEAATEISSVSSVEVPDADLCPRYVARIVQGVTIGPSPFHVRLKLSRAGVRPISNVVDATNLLLLECGQPLHAFDYEFLEEGRIVVRRCDPDEVFTTLDGVERKLPPNSLMIRDGKRSVALAGIMGGLNSEIRDETKTVLIESACFERFGIRRTSKTLGLSTEASYRFERGVDPEETLQAARRAAYWIQKLAGGTILRGEIDVYPEPIARPPVQVRPHRLNSLVGVKLSPQEMVSHLEKLGICCEESKEEDGQFTSFPPSWRWDLEREVDIAEEVARIHGFQNVPTTMPSYQSAPDRTQEHRRRLRKVNELMNASGFTEIITMSFISEQSFREFESNAGAQLSLINPLSEDYVVMRNSLIPGLLSVLKKNMSFKNQDLRLYEIGKTFTPVPDQELPREDLRVGGLATGSRYPFVWNLSRDEKIDFYDVKGALENLFDGLAVPEAQYVPSDLSFLHPGKSANVILDGENIGFLGELSPSKLREHDIGQEVYIFEILLEPLFARTRKERIFKAIPRYPYIERDLSFIVEEKVSGDTIKHLISRLGHDIIASVILFDLYRGESIPKGYQSIAVRIRYQSEDRTLTDEEVQEVHSRVLETLATEVAAAIRE
jgi:phenylalanyl-tRNA synthetase beta chain